jgi:neuronal PAS domain-containing protein 1/3
MTGSSVFDYVHQQDHAEVAEQLGLGLASSTSTSAPHSSNSGLASPSSGASEDHGSSSTANPDGNPFASLLSPKLRTANHTTYDSTRACFSSGHSMSSHVFSVSSVMSLSPSGPYKGYDRAFCVRMKSTLTKRGCHFKSSGYRVSELARDCNVRL